MVARPLAATQDREGPTRTLAEQRMEWVRVAIPAGRLEHVDCLQNAVPTIKPLVTAGADVGASRGTPGLRL